MEDVLKETLEIMRRYNIKANKSLGQNFLINQNAINEIVENSNINEDDLVIEIGPGLGTLTKELLKRAGKVICIELDKKMVKIINERFILNKNFQVINDDVLKVNLKSLIEKEKEFGKIKEVKVVANLPYYITTPIIMKLLEEKLDLISITVMIQKEVADRLIAVPGEKNTGAITYSIFYYAKGEKIIEVSNDSFIPKPEVTSEVIKLNIRHDNIIDISNKDFVFEIIKKVFTQRRKTLLNALVNTKLIENKEKASNILNELGFDINVRAEKLSLFDFEKLAQKIK